MWTMEKCLNSLKINKISNLNYISNESNLISFDFSCDEEIVKTKNNDDLIFNNFETDIKTSDIKGIKYNSNNFDSNINKITNFNFFIFNNKKFQNKVNGVEKVKEKNNKEINNLLLKKRGRKKKYIIKSEDIVSHSIREPHDKYSDDNLRKKCKNIILRYLLKFINDKIKELYKGKIGHGDLKKELKILNQDRKVNSTIDLDKEFLEKKLIDIFSENISSRLSNYSLTHNKTIIESLINENDGDKRDFFKKLFNIKFLDCLKYFRGDDIFIDELKGFKYFSLLEATLLNNHGKDYVNSLKNYLINFETIINNKKSRKSGKNQIKE